MGRFYFSEAVLTAGDFQELTHAALARAGSVNSNINCFYSPTVYTLYQCSQTSSSVLL